jgi:hypothetical protein
MAVGAFGNIYVIGDSLDVQITKLSPPPPPVPGDANGDDVVDRADLAILTSHYGTTTGATFADGDFTGDGRVGLADLTILKNNFGNTASPANGSPTATVPEPSTLWLTLVVWSWLSCRRKWRGSIT